MLSSNTILRVWPATTEGLMTKTVRFWVIVGRLLFVENDFNNNFYVLIIKVYSLLLGSEARWLGTNQIKWNKVMLCALIILYLRSITICIAWVGVVTLSHVWFSNEQSFIQPSHTKPSIWFMLIIAIAKHNISSWILTLTPSPSSYFFNNCYQGLCLLSLLSL